MMVYSDSPKSVLKRLRSGQIEAFEGDWQWAVGIVSAFAEEAADLKTARQRWQATGEIAHLTHEARHKYPKAKLVWEVLWLRRERCLRLTLAAFDHGWTVLHTLDVC